MAEALQGAAHSAAAECDTPPGPEANELRGCAPVHRMRDVLEWSGALGSGWVESREQGTPMCPQPVACTFGDSTALRVARTVKPLMFGSHRLNNVTKSWHAFTPVCSNEVEVAKH